MVSVPRTEEIQKHLEYLQENVSEFRQYFNAHRSELNSFRDRITWYIDSEKTPRSGCIPDFRILLTNIPTTFGDAQIVSHEMEHCRLWHSGFPDLQPDRTGKKSDGLMAGLCSAISNMIYNPMIESHLKFFYPDLCTKDKKLFETQVARLNGVTLKKGLEFQKLCCYYVTGFLTIKLLCEDIPNIEECKYFRSGNGLKIKECGKKIISIFEKNGYFSAESVEGIQPERIIQITKEIADFYHLTFRYSSLVKKVFLSL